MTATVASLPENNASETIDFLRRMASMVSGRSGDSLLRAVAMIESLGQRALSAEQLCHRQQEESTLNARAREAAALAFERSAKQLDAMRARLAEVVADAASERARFEQERGRLLGLVRDAEAQSAKLNAELKELQTSVDTFNETMITVPIEMLRLARAQFDFLSVGFASDGDLISQTISEIGGCAIDQALTGRTADKPSSAPG